MPLHSPPSTRGTLHVIFGTSQLVLLPFAALFVNISLARSSAVWSAARRTLLWTAFLPLFGFVSFALYSAIFVFPLGPGAYGRGVNIGWPPRFAFFSYMRVARKTLLTIANLNWISDVLLILTLTIMTVQMARLNGGHLPQHAPKALPPGVLALDGWADRLIVLSNCAWVLVVAWHAIQVHRNH